MCDIKIAFMHLVLFWSISNIHCSNFEAILLKVNNQGKRSTYVNSEIFSRVLFSQKFEDAKLREYNTCEMAKSLCSQGAKFLKIDLAQLSSQKRFDFRNSLKCLSTTFLGTSYSQIVVAVFKEEPLCTPTPFLL